MQAPTLKNTATLKRGRLLKSLSVLMIVIGIVSSAAGGESAGVTRIACVGDSITRGAGTDFPEWDSYPMQLQRMLGKDAYEVGNFGISGSTLLNAGNQPYQKQKAFGEALKFKPDVVVIQLGTNDTKPDNWKHKAGFIADYRDLVRQFAELQPSPRIYLSLPPFVGRAGDYGGINEAGILEQIPLIEQVARECGASVIDVHGAFLNRHELLGDHVHPNVRGATVLAKTVYAAVLGRPFEGEVPATLRSRWKGHERVDFTVNGRPALLVSPKTAAPGNPWIWRTEFFGVEPAVDLALLEHGWHVAYLSMPNLYGAPAAMEVMDGFPAYLKNNYAISSTPVLEGFSRGGLYAFNWAARRPEQVAALYVDAPVCDFKSWPAGRGKGKGSPGDWTRCLKVYGLTEEQALAWPGNPIDNLAPLAAAKIPVVAVAGDADETVPLDENIGLVEQRYRKLGGEILVIVKPGGGHHPHSLREPAPVVDFLVAACAKPRT